MPICSLIFHNLVKKQVILPRSTCRDYEVKKCFPVSINYF